MKLSLLIIFASLLYAPISMAQTRIYELGSSDEMGRLTAKQIHEESAPKKSAFINGEAFKFHDQKTYTFKPNHLIRFVTRESILAYLAEKGIPSRPKLPAYGKVASESGGCIVGEDYSMLDFSGFCGDDFCAWQGKIYDNYDFGNLLWGTVVRWMKVGYAEAKLGSELNELLGSYRHFEFRLDSRKDQQAIKQGYFKGFKIIFEGLNPKLSIKENLEN